MDYVKLMRLHTVLVQTLDFLKYHSDSPEDLDGSVEEQILMVEAELKTHNPEFESALLYM